MGGLVLFGSTDGLLAVNDVITPPEAIGKSINFTHIRVDNKEIAVMPGVGLKLHESARSLGIEFSTEFSLTV